jgi:peptidoglycan L-alanyl-D-glutamate endopeptidase CwlK
MANRKLTDLHPTLQPICATFLERCKAAGLDILITCTHRTGAEQDELYSHGRTAPGPKVTNARAGQSMHNFTINGAPAAKAFDMVPLVNGKAMWDAKHPAWAKAGAIGEALGLEWAGRWVSFREFPHFQLKG